MRIERLQRSKHVKDRINVFLEDGTLLKITEREILDYHLTKGIELDDDTVRSLRQSAGTSSSKSRAAAIIGRRALSKRDLIRKLVQKGETEEDAQTAADWLEEIGAIDDAAYAAMVVRHCAGMRYGPARYREKLYQAGIDRDLWEDAMAEAPAPDGLIQEFLNSKLRGRMPDAADLRRLANTLARRGFAWSDVKSALRAYENTETFDD